MFVLNFFFNLMLWQYYQRSGGCKFGKACKFNHTRGFTAPISELNFLGLPIRLVQLPILGLPILAPISVLTYEKI
jgi:hypothetical protein